MNVWMNLKVKTKTLVLVAIAVASLLLILSVGLGKMKGMADSEKDMSNAVHHVAILNDLKFHLGMIRLDLVYLMVLDDTAKMAEKSQDIRTRKKAVQEGLASFLKEDLDSKEKALVATFSEGFESYLAQGDKLEQLALQGAGNEQARRQTVEFATKSVAPLSQKPAKAIEELVAYNVEEAKHTYQQDLSTYHSSKFLMGGLTAAAACFMMLVGMLIANSISRPLKMVFDTLSEVAAGDLRARSSIHTRDEMGLLAEEVNVMAEKLMTIMNQVAHNSVQVASAANQLHSTAEQIATGAEEVAAQAATVATASEEMAATSSEIAQSCHHAAQGSELANDRANTGARVVERTVQAMDKIASRVRSSAETVSGLGKRSDQIGEIIGTIEDIADQTNLLALNAAIEAARAGEQGRGFAVVADEVRALAERTTKATREISEMIKTIQVETRNAVGAMEEGVQEVEIGSRETAKSGQALQEILSQIGEVTNQVNQIATAAEEQTATTSEIANNMQQITEVVQQTSQGAQTSASAASHLSTLADELRGLVGQFKLG
jgi:methyl-accepting chemotaxis protein